MSRRAVRTMGRAYASAALTVGLVACGGGGPPAQTAATQVVLTGIALDGTTVYTGNMIAKGAEGTQRTSAPFGGLQAYSISADQLTAPYMLSGPGNYAVATAPRQANVTALTTLLASALFGQDAGSAFTSFGPTSTSTTSRVTDANITSAQAEVTHFLESTVGVTVKSGTQNFVTTPFQPVAGDPMYDTLTALDARITAIGSDAYAAMVASFVTEQRLCIESKVTVTLGAAISNFCPATKSGTPEDADTTVLDDVFTTTAGDVLTLRVRDAAVLGGTYTTAAGAAYACSGSACAGITVGAAAMDLTRTITLNDAPFGGSSGSAVLTGTLTTAVPGVVLPVLPCSDNRFFLIQPDRSVIADCADISDGANTFGIAATFVIEQGSTSYGTYPFRNAGGSNALPPMTAPTTVNVVLDGSTLVSVTVTRNAVDPVTGTPGAIDLDYKCRATACNGVTVGDPTVNGDFGFDAEIRNITFDNTQLAAVNADGSLSTMTFATLKATFAGIFISSLDLGTFAPVMASDCAPYTNAVLTTPADEPYSFGSCAEAVGGTIGSTLLPDGGLELGMNDGGYGDVTVDTDASGAIVRATIGWVPIGESFGCAGIGCAGVSVSAPDGAGNRTVTFDDAVMNIVEPDGYPTGARTATVKGTFVVPPPAPAAARSARATGRP